MSSFSVNHLFTSDLPFNHGLRVGMSYEEIKELQKQAFTLSYSFPDGYHYFFQTLEGLNLNILFDKNWIACEIFLDFEENEESQFYLEHLGSRYEIRENMRLDDFIEFLSICQIEWNFHRNNTYLQTICLQLKNNIKVFYAFGDKSAQDFGLFRIKQSLDGHYLIVS